MRLYRSFRNLRKKFDDAQAMQKQADMLLNTPTPRRHLPLSLLAALFILLIALSAVFCLRTLAGLYEKASRSSSAQSAVDYGVYISHWLAEHPFLLGAENESGSVENFSRTVDWLQKTENAVQSVAVSENDVVLYQKQAGAIDGNADQEDKKTLRRGQTTIGRKKLVVGDRVVPVITFSTVQAGQDGHRRKLEVALNRDVVDRQNANAASALRRMFFFALATIVVGFAVCLAAIIGLVHREMVWQSRRRLDEHLAFAGAVAGSVLHDFRNPLSAMRLDAQLLQNETAKGVECRRERLAELAKRIVGTIDRIDGLLAEFLALARPEQNERELFDANACVLDCIELLKPRFEKAGITLTADLSKERLGIRGFPSQLKRALLNVMTNAEQFSSAGGKVTVQTRLEKKIALIMISDDGPGVAGNDRRKIFDLFYSKRPGGTGIGLTLARTAIENCGGDITAETAPGGRGALFSIKIPMVSG